MRLEHEHAVARDVRRPAREVGAEVGLDVGADERRAVVGDVRAARHPGAAVGRVAAAVAALVVDEGVDVQPVLDRQAVRVQRVAHRGRVAGVAAQDEPVVDARGRERLLRAGHGGLAAVDADHAQRALVEVAAAQGACRGRARRMCTSQRPSSQPVSTTKRGWSASGSRSKMLATIGSASAK